MTLTEASLCALVRVLVVCVVGVVVVDGAELQSYDGNVFIEVSSGADAFVVRSGEEPTSLFGLKDNITRTNERLDALRSEVEDTANSVAAISTAQERVLANVTEHVSSLRTAIADVEVKVSTMSSETSGATASLATALQAAEGNLDRLARQHSAELSFLAGNFSSELSRQLSEQEEAFGNVIASLVSDTASARESLRTQVLQETEQNAASQIAAATANTLAPGELPTASTLPDCTAQTTGRLRFKDNSVQLCIEVTSEQYQWRGVDVPRPTGLSTSEAAASCKEALASQKALGLNIGDGVHWIKKGGSGSPTQVWCDMTSDGGGWTLVAYAGSISGNKQNTAGTSFFFPLFGHYGTYDPEAPSTRSTFSLLKDAMFSHLFVASSQILAKRTTVPQHQMIFPVANVDDYNQNQLPPVPYLRVTRDGTNYYDRTNINIFPNYGCKMPCYTGYDDNWCTTLDCDSSNQDNAGSFNSKVSHRAMLYWEINEGSYSASQWFHATPLNMHRSSSAENTVQDIEFYLRESTTY
ncbi:hypothetical protein PTSG_11257 [Salpingoeca rosetta]|uniref:Fibrinogen C-terminal domain-containing protein n=1 Tax=Salpingoeca rosetta (strain ATCC 50818 / BSB-021) TaxID=946362 RepID=F2USW0_SALR5|nr:uncharacterized protein PTSG_11257 [Salpingoeca rosetta]EGD81219.1 hypothetical protein PTSG_11257 [Salpingoeca rosetta]|eukprot:XP_004987753.1 hypothetical protein PTSG_11257 [Salpingoeca rosetta]